MRRSNFFCARIDRVARAESPRPVLTWLERFRSRGYRVRVRYGRRLQHETRFTTDRNARITMLAQEHGIRRRQVMRRGLL